MSKTIRYITGRFIVSDTVCDDSQVVQGICDVMRCNPDDISMCGDRLYIDKGFENCVDIKQVIDMLEKLEFCLETNGIHLAESHGNEVRCWHKDGEKALIWYETIGTQRRWIDYGSGDDFLSIEEIPDMVLRYELRRRHILRQLANKKNKNLKKYGKLPTEEEYALRVMMVNAHRRPSGYKEYTEMPEFSEPCPDIYEIEQYLDNEYGPVKVNWNRTPVDDSPYATFSTEVQAYECVKRLGAVLAHDVDW